MNSAIDTSRFGHALRLTGMAVLLSGSLNAGAVVIEAPDLSVMQGGTVEAVISVDDLNGDFIAGYDLLVGYDPAVVDLRDVSFSNALDTSDGDAPETLFDDISAGQVNVVGINLFGTVFENQDGSTPFDLFSLTFDALAVGTSAITLLPNALGSGVFFTDPLGNALSESNLDGSIVVTQAPPVGVAAPGPLSMILGVVALTMLQRRPGLRTGGSHPQG